MRPVNVDERNVVDPDAWIKPGFAYHGIGRRDKNRHHLIPTPPIISYHNHADARDPPAGPGDLAALHLRGGVQGLDEVKSGSGM